MLAPVGPSGIAVLGDTDHFVTMGKKRVTGITDRGEAKVTVSFAEGETSVVITGYSPVTPVIAAIEGSIGAVTYSPSTHLFHVPVTVGYNNSATIRIQQSHPGLKPGQPPAHRLPGKTGVQGRIASVMPD